jgi:hypothetical protein
MTDSEYLPLFGTVIAKKIKANSGIKYKVEINGVTLTIKQEEFVKLFKPKKQLGL